MSDKKPNYNQLLSKFNTIIIHYEKDNGLRFTTNKAKYKNIDTGKVFTSSEPDRGYDRKTSSFNKKLTQDYTGKTVTFPLADFIKKGDLIKYTDNDWAKISGKKWGSPQSCKVRIAFANKSTVTPYSDPITIGISK